MKLSFKLQGLIYFSSFKKKKEKQNIYSHNKQFFIREVSKLNEIIKMKDIKNMYDTF